MPHFKIGFRWSAGVKFEGEYASMELCIKAAFKAGISLSDSNLSDSNLRGSDLRDSNLRGSDLSDSDLRGSDLRDSNLSDSNLSGSNLRGSDLRGSDLRGSDLRGSDLSDSNLSCSSLSGSDLRGSNLRGSNLRGSDLRDSDLRGSNLSGSNLTTIRDDFWAVLSSAPSEVHALIEALKNGKVDGSTYEGPCACLVGTLANAKRCDYRKIDGLTPNPLRPAETFFTAIKPGDVPKKSQFAKIALGWAEEWLARMQLAFSSK